MKGIDTKKLDNYTYTSSVGQNLESASTMLKFTEKGYVCAFRCFSELLSYVFRGNSPRNGFFTKKVVEFEAQTFKDKYQEIKSKIKELDKRIGGLDENSEEKKNLLIEKKQLQDQVDCFKKIIPLDLHKVILKKSKTETSLSNPETSSSKPPSGPLPGTYASKMQGDIREQHLMGPKLFYEDGGVKKRCQVKQNGDKFKLVERNQAETFPPKRDETEKYANLFLNGSSCYVTKPSIDDKQCTFPVTGIDTSSIDFVFYPDRMVFYAQALPEILNITTQMAQASEIRQHDSFPVDYLLTFWFKASLDPVEGVYLPEKIAEKVENLIAEGKDPSAIIEHLQLIRGCLTIFWKQEGGDGSA